MTSYIWLLLTESYVITKLQIILGDATDRKLDLIAEALLAHIRFWKKYWFGAEVFLKIAALQ